MGAVAGCDSDVPETMCNGKKARRPKSGAPFDVAIAPATRKTKRELQKYVLSITRTIIYVSNSFVEPVEDPRVKQVEPPTLS
jgi:hypothetical protein